MKCSCGCELFMRYLPTRGTWTQLIKVVKGRVEIEDSSTDKLSYTEPRTVICAECRKRHPNPSLTTHES